MKSWHFLPSILFISCVVLFTACRGKVTEEDFQVKAEEAAAPQPSDEEGAAERAEKEEVAYGIKGPDEQADTEPLKDDKDEQPTKKKLHDILANPIDEGLLVDLLPDEEPGYHYKKTSPTKIIPGKPEVKGSLHTETIKKVIKQHHHKMLLCYEKQQFKDRDLKGTVTLQLIIAPTGKVKMSKISASTMDNPTVESCLAAAAEKWVFPEPKGGDVVFVTYPFTFEPVEKKETEEGKKGEE